MKILIAGGTGLIGQALANNWLEVKHDLTILGRSKEKIHRIFKNKVAILTWDELRHAQEVVLNHDLIVNLAGCNITSHRWNAARKQEILDSRIETTSLLAEICAEQGKDAPNLFNASGVGIYGTQPEVAEGLPPHVDEKKMINFDEAPDFLAHVAREWEKATLPAKNSGTRVVNMRFGVVLSKEGGALPQLAMPTKLFIGGRVGSGLQPISWITLADLIYAIDFIWQLSQIRGPVNFVAPKAVTQYEFAQALGKVLYRPAFMRVPTRVIKLLFGEMAETMVLHGQNVKPSRLLEHGFNFSYPDIIQALRRIYH